MTSPIFGTDSINSIDLSLDQACPVDKIFRVTEHLSEDSSKEWISVCQNFFEKTNLIPYPYMKINQKVILLLQKFSYEIAKVENSKQQKILLNTYTTVNALFQMIDFPVLNASWAIRLARVYKILNIHDDSILSFLGRKIFTLFMKRIDNKNWKYVFHFMPKELPKILGIYEGYEETCSFVYDYIRDMIYTNIHSIDTKLLMTILEKFPKKTLADFELFYFCVIEKMNNPQTKFSGNNLIKLLSYFIHFNNIYPAFLQNNQKDFYYYLFVREVISYIDLIKDPQILDKGLIYQALYDFMGEDLLALCKEDEVVLNSYYNLIKDLEENPKSDQLIFFLQFFVKLDLQNLSILLILAENIKNYLSQMNPSDLCQILANFAYYFIKNPGYKKFFTMQIFEEYIPEIQNKIDQFNYNGLNVLTLSFTALLKEDHPFLSMLYIRQFVYEDLKKEKK